MGEITVEDRMKELQDKYVALSNDIKHWLRSELATEHKIGARGLDLAITRLQESHYWVSVAAGDINHFAQDVAPKLELAK